jgi:hypothetical protein
VAAAVLAGLLTTGATAAPAPSASPDPRLAEIRRRLEHFGLRVVDVGHAPATASAPDLWIAVTVAKYDQPSWDRVTDQALTVWNVLYAMLRREAPRTLLASAQDWKTYRLFLSTSLEKIAAFDQGVRTAQTDANRTKVFQALYTGAMLRVFDLQQQKWLESSEFVKQWFVK